METKVIYPNTLQHAMDFLDRFEDDHTKRSKALLPVVTRAAEETIPPDGYSRTWKLASISDGGTLYDQGLVSLAQYSADSTVIQVTGEDSEPCQRYADGLRAFLDSERQGLSLQPAGVVSGSAADQQPIPNSKTTNGAGDGQAEPILPPEEFGKAHLPSYNLTTAKQIADAIPLAWQAKEQDPDFETKYNNQTIADKAGATHETVSRYLGVFRDYGITHIKDIPLPKAGKRKPGQ